MHATAGPCHRVARLWGPQGSYCWSPGVPWLWGVGMQAGVFPGAVWRRGLLSDRGKAYRQKSKGLGHLPTFTKHLPWAGPPTRPGPWGSYAVSGHHVPHCTVRGTESCQTFPLSIRTFGDVCVSSSLPLQEEPLLRREAGLGIPQLQHANHFLFMDPGPERHSQGSPHPLSSLGPALGLAGAAPTPGIPHPTKPGHLSSSGLVFPFLLSQMAESSRADCSFFHPVNAPGPPVLCPAGWPCLRPWGHRSGLVRWGWPLRTAHP